jgi:hypothetical protein
MRDEGLSAVYSLQRAYTLHFVRGSVAPCFSMPGSSVQHGAAVAAALFMKCRQVLV